MFLFLLASPQIYSQPSTICGLCHSSFLTHALVLQTTWSKGCFLNLQCQHHFYKRGAAGTSVVFAEFSIEPTEFEDFEGNKTISPHAEDDDGRERHLLQNRKWNMHVSFLAGKDRGVCVCVSQQSHLFGGGTPGGVPPSCVYPDRRTDIWSPHEPQAPKRETHFLRGLLQMCVCPLKTCLRCSFTPYITLAALFTAPLPPIPV